MNIYLCEVGLRPASTRNGISIYPVEQADLFPTNPSLRPVPCNSIVKPDLSTLNALDILHNYFGNPSGRRSSLLFRLDRAGVLAEHAS